MVINLLVIDDIKVTNYSKEMVHVIV